jgi:biopolymer transport protein ExbB
VFELVKAGDWAIIPLLACSVIALAIILERAWALQRRRVVPHFLLDEVRRWQAEAGEVDEGRIEALRTHSPLGRVLAAGLAHAYADRARMKEAIEEAGRHVVIELERFLNTLGTIATIAPLLGLFGTVVGMIQTFNAISVAGLGDPAPLASGIAVALINTAAGLFVAIPAYIFHRYYRGKVDELVVDMEQAAIALVDTVHAPVSVQPARMRVRPAG